MLQAFKGKTGHPQTPTSTYHQIHHEEQFEANATLANLEAVSSTVLLRSISNCGI